MNTALHDCISLANSPLINVQNWLEGFNIRQKRDRIKNMAEHSDEKLQDIKGQLLTIQSLIEMTGQDILDYFGKDPSAKDAYQSLVQSREEILKTKQTLPHLN
jgi:hypothetical protein